MQTPEEGEITPEVLSSYEYQVIETSIEELTKVLITIQEGMSSEFAQVQTLQKILDSQLNLLTGLNSDSVVSLQHIKNLKDEYQLCMLALRQKADTIKTLNRYLNERIAQMNILHRKRQEIIKKYQSAQIIEFKGKNEKKQTD